MLLTRHNFNVSSQNSTIPELNTTLTMLLACVGALPGRPGRRPFSLVGVHQPLQLLLQSHPLSRLSARHAQTQREHDNIMTHLWLFTHNHSFHMIYLMLHHSLVELLGEFDHLRGQRHAGFHHHQVPGAGGVSLSLGTLRRSLPLLVLHRHVGAVLYQSLKNSGKKKRKSQTDNKP